MPANPPPEGEPYVPIQYTSDVFPTERADTGYPPTGRARRKTQRSAGRQRSSYHPRPEPRRRAELMGFNATWWMTLIVALVVVLVLSVLII
jgi:hypothetical protein